MNITKQIVKKIINSLTNNPELWEIGIGYNNTRASYKIDAKEVLALEVDDHNGTVTITNPRKLKLGSWNSSKVISAINNLNLTKLHRHIQKTLI